MPVLIVAGIIVIVVVVAVVRALVHVIEASPGIAIGCALIGVPGTALVAWAVLRGTMRHVIVSVPAKQPPPQLPAPAPRREIEAAPAPVADPFSADAASWAQLAEDADREELLRPGRREARAVLMCEGPGCRHRIEGEPWVVDVEEDGHAEFHSFCSGEGAQLWQDHDREARAS